MGYGYIVTSGRRFSISELMTRPRPLYTLFVVSALLIGCTSVAEKGQRSAAITAHGEASIENFTEKQLTVTRIYLLKTDGTLAQPKGMGGVYPLSAGRHDLVVNAEWSRMNLGGLYIDAGQASLTLVAEAAKRYLLRGEKLNQHSAIVWIEEAGDARRVSENTITLSPTRQEVPIIVPVLPGR